MMLTALASWMRSAVSGISMSLIIAIGSRRLVVARGDGGNASAVTRGHRLDQVERLAASNFSDDDAVGPEAERRAEQVADGDFAAALRIRRTRFELADVCALELELARVFDDDDALA